MRLKGDFPLNIMFLSEKIFTFLTSKIFLEISLLIKFEYLYARESYFFSIVFGNYIHFILKQSQYCNVFYKALGI